ncbi:diacylglycerol/lipid kinase family protein [Sandaracinus amylolyticus]|uniref:Transcription regulator n=1 Tax=Sandaracinus amylolyticus TaxID=927083 RepID=A0A0F6W291_9BACT|nr:YegS/Rv2252/BmrU family lipid kinase [Sandaracinus amylolyticus]AKF05580.1 Transcription regulator [Sandaracinus amylolyticus]
MDRDSFLLVVNPRAGAGRAEKRLPALSDALHAAGAKFEVARTAGPRHATEIVRDALGRGVRGIGVVGGDGTLNEAVNGFFDGDGRVIDPDAWIGPLSCGTGGDFRKTIGSPDVGAGGRGMDALASRFVAATPRPLDVGWLEMLDHDGAPARRAFLNIASFGVGGLVDRLVNETPKWMGGTPAFFLGTVRALARYRSQRVRVRLDDGAARETKIVNMAVANGRFFGGGMQIAPRAEIDDGLFDVVGLEMDVSASFGLTSRIYRGRHLDRPGVSFERARRVRAEPVSEGDHVLLDVDGEAPGRLPATFSVRASAIHLRG